MLPLANRKVEKGCMTLMLCSGFIRCRQTYAAIRDVIDALLDKFCKSAKGAFSVAPWMQVDDYALPQD